MKYIRTKDGKILENKWCSAYDAPASLYNNIEKQANSVEELCDKFVVVNVLKGVQDVFDSIGYLKKEDIRKRFIIYGAIWTDKGLIYVAKMNDKGELELL